METCYKNDYLLIKYDAERNILFSYWYTPENMSDKEYRNEFKNYMKIVFKFEPEFKLLNLNKAKYAIPIETHQWITSKINEMHETYNVKKVAATASKNFLAHLANEMISEDIELQNANLNFFLSEEEALAWLMSEEDINIQAA